MLRLSRNAGRGGSTKVFNRGIGCPMGHWTDDTLYRDTTSAGWAASPSTKKAGERGVLSGLSAPICGASGLCLVSIHYFIVIVLGHIFNIDHHSAFDMNLYCVHKMKFILYILSLAKRGLLNNCSVNNSW